MATPNQKISKWANFFIYLTFVFQIDREKDAFKKLNDKLGPMAARSNPEDKVTLQEALDDMNAAIPEQQALAGKVRSAVVCVCVCVYERERGRERESMCVCVCMRE